MDVDGVFRAQGLQAFTTAQGKTIYYRTMSALEDPTRNTHGSHVASTIAGEPCGLATGLAPDAKLLDLRVSNSALGRGALWFVGDALEYALHKNADVVNLSLGSPLEDAGTTEVIGRLLAAGTAVVAATGNSQETEDGLAAQRIAYPARCPGVISVGAENADARTLASFSEVGQRLEVLASGVDVLGASSLLIDGYVTKSGTSMATPFVAGLCALLLSAAKKYGHPKPDARKLLFTLISQAHRVRCADGILRPENLEERDDLFGYGGVGALTRPSTFATPEEWLRELSMPEDFDVG